MVDAKSPANCPLTRARRVPGHSDSRTEILVETAGKNVGHRQNAGGRYSCVYGASGAQQHIAQVCSLCRVRVAVVVPAQAQGQGQIRPRFPLILDERALRGTEVFVATLGYLAGFRIERHRPLAVGAILNEIKKVVKSEVGP